VSTVSQPAATTSRPPLQPVEVQGRIVVGHGRTVHDLFNGCAVLLVAQEGKEESYWVSLVVTPDGHIGLVKLQKFATGEQYTLPATLDDCECGDATWRSERPGGCKHQQALRQALVAVAAEKAKPHQRPPHRVERDEQTQPPAA
jgi:hypothetical protein